MIRKPIIVKYENLEDVIKSCYRIKSPDPLTGWMPEPVHFTTLKGRRLKKKKYHVTWAEFMKLIRENNRVWGYTSGVKKVVVRYWVAEDATERDIIEFFAHEIGHHMGRTYSNETLEEGKAVSYERTAVLAYDIAQLVLEDDLGYSKKKKGRK